MVLLTRSLKGVASILLAVAWCSALWGWGCKGYKTPEEAVEGFGVAMQACDEKKMKTVLTKEFWNAVEELSMNIKAMLPEEKAKTFVPLQWWCEGAKGAKWEVGTSRVKGKDAQVEVTIVDDKGKRAKYVVPVVEEDDGWKVDLIGFWKRNPGEGHKGE